MSGRSAYKAFVPTEDHRQLVHTLVAMGIREDSIARCIRNPQTGRPIDAKTLRKHFREEIDTAEVQMLGAVGKSLFRLATGSGRAAVTACMFILRTRGGWREPPRAIEHSGPAGAPIESTSLNMSPSEFEEIARRVVKEF